ncbi:MAG: tRNA (adenine-N1)-methyltransferase [bacterium]
MSAIAPNDWVLVLTAEGRRYLLRAEPGKQFHTHRGILNYDDILGRPFGARAGTFYALKPTFHEIIKKGVKRQTQIVYPKDSGYLLLKLGVQPGAHVLEIGAGSGAMSILLANFVRPSGHVTSYEMREEFVTLASKNLERFGLAAFVTLKHRDVRNGLDEDDCDACFIDVREPWELFEAAWRALSGGAMLGTLVPTTNQAQQCIAALDALKFMDIEMVELLERPYKTNAERLRPADRMVAHTAFLITARKVLEK